MKIGDNIIRLRKEKGLRRSALVKKLAFIYGENAIDYRTIERIERGDMAKGHLSSLLQIAEGLEVGLDELYKGTEYEDKKYEDKATLEEHHEGAYIKRADERGGIYEYTDKETSLEIMSPDNSTYGCYYLRIAPHSKTKLEQDPEGTIKFLVVTGGEISVSCGSLERTLYKGDAIEIKSSKPHYFENKTKVKASGILYQSPKSL